MKALHSYSVGVFLATSLAARRKPGDPNPYVIGNASITRYVTMVGECAKAGLLRLT